jgi:hypothetical protein
MDLIDLLRNLIQPSSLKRWQVQNLDYNWYFALTIIGGFFGIDYLYLGSPLGALTKWIFNIFTLGYWWYYDALNAAVSQDKIRLYGPSAPVLGPTGLAGARFRDPDHPTGPKKQLDKHLNFLIYAVVLICTGIIGGDSFLTGDFYSGVIRLFSFISFIGAPIAIFWWVCNLYYYFLDTGSCVDQNWNYLGAERPANRNAECPSALMTFTIWALQTTLVVAEMVLAPIPGVNYIIPILRTLIERLKEAYGFIEPIVKDAALAAEKSQELFEELSGHEAPSVDEIKKTRVALEKMTLSQMGGAEEDTSSLLAPFFALTIVFIIASSIIVSYRRSTQNATSTATTATAKTVNQRGGEETDEPPQPGNPRVPVESV